MRPLRIAAVVVALLALTPIASGAPDARRVVTPYEASDRGVVVITPFDVVFFRENTCEPNGCVAFKVRSDEVAVTVQVADDAGAPLPVMVRGLGDDRYVCGRTDEPILIPASTNSIEVYVFHGICGSGGGLSEGGKITATFSRG